MTYHMYMKFGFLWFSYYLDIIYIYIYSRNIVHFWFSKSSCSRFRGFHTKSSMANGHLLHEVPSVSGIDLSKVRRQVEPGALDEHAFESWGVRRSDGGFC